MLKVPSDGSGMSSEHEAPQDELEQAARELAYQMAYGLSHELNNPLANIAARGRLLAESEPDLHRRQQLAAIVDQAMRGCEMIADLMVYARPPQLHCEPVAVSPMITALVKRAQAWCTAHELEIRFQIQPEVVSQSVVADQHAIEEALWAIMRNAIEVAHARVDIEVSVAENKRELVIEVTDDGPGLSQEALALAFHPFFSGREAGRGIGLGLSKARRLLEMNNGSLSIANGELKGCRVRVSFNI